MNNKLAIIIPAYKSEYLDDCLNSIASQTNKNFTLYVGNDGSPYDIDSIVDKYYDKIDIQYKKFPDNLGSTSLVKHWERCIDMIDDEEWIWLFSDDDMMDENAIDAFYKMRPEYSNVYRFNLIIIDEQNESLGEVIYNDCETSVSFLENRLKYKYINAITNYIFSIKSYKKTEGFVDFPLAWGSDDTSIIQFAENGKIRLIKDSKVSWRNSISNISMLLNKATTENKISARIALIQWLYTRKYYLLQKIANNEKVVAKWFLHALKIEYASASDVKKLVACYRIYPYLGNIIFKEFLSDKKNKIKSRLYKIYKSLGLNWNFKIFKVY